MRIAAAFIALFFSMLIVAYSTNAPLSVLVAMTGFLGAVVALFSARGGATFLLVPIALSVLFIFTYDWGMVFYTLMYLLPMLMCRHDAARQELAEERAARMDRYVRSQLGE